MGQVTASGIWYPDDSDPSDIKTLLATVASSIEDTVGAVVADTGWVDIQTNSGFEVQNGTTPQVRKEGKRVTMRWGWSSKGMTTAGNTYRVGMIPAGFTPSRTQYGPVTGNTVVRSGRGIVWGDGAVDIQTAADIASYYLFGNWNWYTD